MVVQQVQRELKKARAEAACAAEELEAREAELSAAHAQVGFQPVANSLTQQQYCVPLRMDGMHCCTAAPIRRTAYMPACWEAYLACMRTQSIE